MQHGLVLFPTRRNRVELRILSTPLGRTRGRPACALPSRAVSLLTELDAFFTEHGQCGDLDAGAVEVGCEAMNRMVGLTGDGEA